MWANELEEYTYDLSMSKDKHEKKLYKKYKDNYDSTNVKAFLRLYLERCKYNYVFAFLQMRGVIQGSDKKDLSEVFRSRQEFLFKLIAKSRELYAY